ncbi:alpha/beta hydrolase [Yinghuangia seranimata]|uniref:alpha/beta hydrolase n=1 Tax=Yinghuangia seranimata TaxID=408067 RepID=UPI00248B3FB1|nr:alpha/beta fold hydrolase [Yinghuangia seranimata]MDI2125179.1 alpha/beta fold hydrolase [Yinghuangia seranimata]
MQHQVESVQYDVASVHLSGLLARPAGAARGTVLALHGGGSHAAYWHRDAAPDTSLLLLGASLGWTVLAVDRPGYGASAGLPRDRQDLDHQADLMFRLVDELPAHLGSDAGAGVFLAAHSMGALLALRMGGRDDARLLGVAAGGVPLRYSEDKARAMAAVPTDGEGVVPPMRGPGTGAATYFGPPGSYDPALLTREGRVVAPVPIAEFADARDSPLTLPGILAKVRVPVHWTVAEFESSNLAGPAVLDEAGRLLTHAPRVELHTQPGVGHNLSLHYAARAYHLRVMAFAEECRRRAA